jgi:hypothetical protein
MDDVKRRITTRLLVPIVGEVYSDEVRKVRLIVTAVTDRAVAFTGLKGDELWIRAVFQAAANEGRIVLRESKKDVSA